MGWRRGGRGPGAAPAVCPAGGRSGSWTLQPQLRLGGSSARPSAGAGAAPLLGKPARTAGEVGRGRSLRREGQGLRAWPGGINSSSEWIRREVLLSPIITTAVTLAKSRMRLRWKNGANKMVWNWNLIA